MAPITTKGLVDVPGLGCLLGAMLMSEGCTELALLLTDCIQGVFPCTPTCTEELALVVWVRETGPEGMRSLGEPALGHENWKAGLTPHWLGLRKLGPTSHLDSEAELALMKWARESRSQGCESPRAGPVPRLGKAGAAPRGPRIGELAR